MQRTLAVVDRLKHDREDMVVKAVSWALRSLVAWDRTAVDRYLAANAAILHARVRREVGNKLRTGRKNPGRVSG
ncbi:MAG: DNA alkylation repair protein [Pseudomonadales bacterium]